MKSLKQLFEEMGFNPRAPLEVQKAFFKHLVASANATSCLPVNATSIKVLEPDNKKAIPRSSQSEHQKKAMTQLEFDFSAANFSVSKKQVS